MHNDYEDDDSQVDDDYHDDADGLNTTTCEEKREVNPQFNNLTSLF